MIRPLLIGALMAGGLAACDTSEPNPATLRAPQAGPNPPGTIEGSPQTVASAQAILNRFGYSVDATTLTTDQQIRLTQIDTVRQLNSAVRRDINAVLRRGA